MPPNVKKPVTLKNIAEDTGFSITTVSHALRDLSDISEATKAIVRKRASALGYIGNASASALRSGYSNTVAVLLGDLSNPHFAFMATQLECHLKDLGYTAIFMNTNEDESTERNAIMLALSRQVDGIIICPAQTAGSSENLRFLLGMHIPCVLIGRHFSDLSVDYVICDDYKGGLTAGRHIIEHGHRRILYIDTPIQNSSAIERREGFFQALQECPDPVRFSVARFDVRGDYLKALGSSEHLDYTALIAFNDLIAWDVLCRLAASGLHVPEDISIVGFDNLHSYLPLPFALTSVSSSKIAMPRKAVDLLMDRIQNRDIPIRSLKLDVELIDRHTVRSIK